MTEKILKSLTFADSDDIYIIESGSGGVGQATEYGGEIFNDYENNQALGKYSHAEGYRTQALGANSHAEGQHTVASGRDSHAGGEDTLASGARSMAIGYQTIASGSDSMAQGKNTVALAEGSHAEGFETSTVEYKKDSNGNYLDTSGNITTDPAKYVIIAQGKYAHVEGRNAIASGQYSHSEGFETKSSSSYAHSEGTKTSAVGNGAHAEGNGTLAAGTSSHAEGYTTQTDSKATGSHAEGYNTIAYGNYSHAEGRGTKSYGEASHTEGRNCQTTSAAQCAHAEGINTKAAGTYSHAEGSNSQSNGNSSHAEGEYTIAAGRAQHVSGKYNVEDKEIDANGYGKYAYIIGGGTLTTNRKNIHTVDWDGNAWYAGKITAGNTNIAYSPAGTAFGMNTMAGVKGFNMIAVDTENMLITVNDSMLDEKAVNVYSIGDILQFDAKNHNYFKLKITSLATNASGQSVIGVENTTGDPLNLSLDSDPTENYCWVIGKNFGEIFNVAKASHSEGDGTIAAGRSTHAEGRGTRAVGNYSHAEGRETTAAYVAHAEGRGTRALGDYSHAEGQNSTANGYASHAEGNSTAFGQYSHAEGASNMAEGTFSHAEGYGNTALGTRSHAEGDETTAEGGSSHTEGQKTSAFGLASHAEGHATQAIGEFTHSEGLGTIATVSAQHVQGKYNIKDTEDKYAHIIGGGSSDEERKNIHTVDWNGNAWFAGKITAGANPTEAMDVATKEYVDSVASGSAPIAGESAQYLLDQSSTYTKVYSRYGGDTLNSMENTTQNLVVWVHSKVNGELELRPLSLSGLVDALSSHFYKKDELAVAEEAEF